MILRLIRDEKSIRILIIGVVVLIVIILVAKYTPINFLYPQKVWAHRTNSIERLNDIENNFFGVELDVVFVDSLNQFDVNHPPEKSLNLSLYDYLSASKNRSKLKFWLDFKNLTTQNKDKALKKLLQICTDLNLEKSQIIVESERVELLQGFNKHSFKVSYYIHWPGLHTLNKQELKNKISKINTNLDKIDFSPYLSSDYKDYKILSKEFSNKRILLWCENLSNTLKQRWRVYQTLADEKVEVLLIKPNSEIKER